MHFNDTTHPSLLILGGCQHRRGAAGVHRREDHHGGRRRQGQPHLLRRVQEGPRKDRRRAEDEHPLPQLSEKIRYWRGLFEECVLRYVRVRCDELIIVMTPAFKVALL